LLSIRSAITYYSSNWEVKNMNPTNFCTRRKTKEVKQAVHGTKKISQYHAQPLQYTDQYTDPIFSFLIFPDRENWLAACMCFSLLRRENFNYTIPAHKMQETSRLFPFKHNSYSNHRIDQKERIADQFSCPQCVSP
jgi:hypothetical protein